MFSKVIKSTSLNKLLKRTQQSLNVLLKQQQQQRNNSNNNNRNTIQNGANNNFKSNKISNSMSRSLLSPSKSATLRQESRKRYSNETNTQKNGRLFDKVAIVTGAGGRVGKGICKILQSEGATVIAVDRNEDRLEKTGKELKCDTVVADCTNEDDVSRYVQTMYEKYSRFDVLVNATRMKGDMKPFHKTNFNDMEQILKCNLISPMLNCKHVLPYMVSRRTGSIINLGSFLYSTMALPGLSNYVIAKHGIIGLTNSIASEYGKKGIRCNTVSPGPTTDVRINDDIADYVSNVLGINKDAVLKLAQQEGNVSLKSVETTDVEDIARTVLFLASDDSSYVNSANIDVDGGLKFRSTL